LEVRVGGLQKAESMRGIAWMEKAVVNSVLLKVKSGGGGGALLLVGDGKQGRVRMGKAAIALRGRSWVWGGGGGGGGGGDSHNRDGDSHGSGLKKATRKIGFSSERKAHCVKAEATQEAKTKAVCHLVLE